MEDTRAKYKNIHQGHRDRVYDNLDKTTSFDGYSDIEALEIMLFAAIPMKDTNPIAHALLDEFGNLNAVLTASPAELKNIPGMTKAAAYMLPYIYPFAAKAHENVLKRTHVGKSSLAADYIIAMLKYRKNEAFGVIALDINDCIINSKIIMEGECNSVNIDLRRLTDFCLKQGTDRVIICHNHPTGMLSPSQDDVNVTVEIFETLIKLGIVVVDHVIVGPGSNYYSFYENQLMDICYKALDDHNNTKYLKDFKEKYSVLNDKRQYLRPEVLPYANVYNRIKRAQRNSKI